MKLTKNARKTRGDMFYPFAGMTSLMLKSELSTFQLYNFVKSDQNTTKLCTRLFVHIINKNLT